MNLREELCPDKSYDDIVKMAAVSEYDGIFDVNDDMFSAPKSMKSAIDQYIFGHGRHVPECTADYFRAAYNSLGVCYGESIAEMEENTGKTYEKIYIVGGGAKNAYLNEITEKYTHKKVVAMPMEATAIGNLKIQIKRQSRR